MKKNLMKIRALVLASAFMFLLFGFSGNAEAKSFQFERIDFIYKVNKDSTVDVSEVITYDFDGQFNTANRSLLLSGTDDIDNIEVFEVFPDKGDVPLVRKISKQNKLSQSSWGSYYVLNDIGKKDINIYFNADTEKKAFRINYTLHGSITFLQDKDELYWDLFTDFEAPIASIAAIVQLPEKVQPENLQGVFYYSGAHSPEDIVSEVLGTSDEVNGYTSFKYELRNIATGEDVTIAAGFPKGVVDKRAYFIDLAKTFYPYIVSILAILFTAMYLLVNWYLKEVKGNGGTVVAQFTPPRNLRPAVMDLVLTEDISIQALTATIIDLAVRGYIKIEEDMAGFLKSSSLPNWIKSLAGKDYILTLIKPVDENLSPFEKRYVTALKLESKPFSTREYRNNRNVYLATEIPIVKNAAYKDTTGIEDIFTVSVKDEKMPGNKPYYKHLLAVIFVVFLYVFLLLKIFDRVPGFKFVSMFAVLYFCYVAFIRYTKYEAFLSPVGRKFRDEILGFKLFLSVTGKDRMQNLTPDMFEKYLPYAILFKVEKEWAKNFTSMHLQQPNWYYGGYVAGSSMSGASSFSASSFSSSLSSSFSSAMSSSGASGGSGGGGGAGGGGGGGGGGAS